MLPTVRIAYFDCFSGISGDMTLGALVDAGVDARAIVEAVARLGLEFELTFETVRRGGFRATHAKVVAPEEHAHRHLHLEFVQAQTQPPKFDGALHCDGAGTAWRVLCDGAADSVRAQAARAGAKIVQESRATLEDIFVARVGY